jgi:hypothetical protein
MNRCMRIASLDFTDRPRGGAYEAYGISRISTESIAQSGVEVANRATTRDGLLGPSHT